MRVMFISHVSSKYGAARSLLDLIDGLLQKGVKCYVVLPAPGPMVAELERRGVTYNLVPFKWWASRGSGVWKRVLRGGFNLLMSLVIAAKARAWQADIIYTNSSVTPVGALAAVLIGKPHLWHIREFGQEDYDLSFDLGLKWSIKLMEWLSFRVIVISEALKRKYLQYMLPQKVELVYNPASSGDGVLVSDPVAPRSPGQHSIPTLAIVGLIHRGKGQMDAVLSVAELVRQGVEVNLKIVGDGDRGYLNQLKQALAENSIHEYVEFTGYVDDPAQIMRSADIVLVCSRSEAFGRVTVEAMLSRKPVIGARSGATPELIKEGFNGLLYEPGNYRELAEKIKYLIRHPKEAKRMGANGFERVSTKFTIREYTDKIFDILQRAEQANRP